MPYTGPADPKLPDNVKRLPAKQKRQWIEVFNDAFARCKAGKLKPPKGGLKKGNTCERRAFAVAYGVVKGAKSMDYEKAEAEGQKEAEGAEAEADRQPASLTLGTTGAETKGEKCSHAAGEKCSECMVAVEVMPPPLGGATSFSAADEYEAAQKQDMEIHDQEYTFRVIFDNIMRMPNEEMSLPQKATAVRVAASDLATRVRGSATASKSLLDRAKDAFGFGSKDERNSVFQAFKDTGGEWRWLAVASNKFRDRGGEIFPEEAHKEYVAHVDATGDYPELRVFHVLGSGIGRADFVAYADGFRIDSGTFYKGFDDVAERLAKSEEPLGVSHGFRYKLKDLGSDGVYRRYRSFEDSIVPSERAENPWTEWTAERVKEVLDMPLAPAKMAFLVDKVGKERAAEIAERLPAAEKALESMGIGWKEAAVIGEALEEAPAAPAPAPVPPAPAPATPPAGEPAPAAVASPATPAPAQPAPAPATPPVVAEGGKPGGDEEPAEKALAEQVLEGVKALNARMDTLATDVEGLKKTDEEKLRDKATPAAARVLGQPRPTEGNVIDAEKAQGVIGEGDPPPSTAKPYVEDLMRTGAVGVLNLGSAPPVAPPAAPAEPAAPSNGQ